MKDCQISTATATQINPAYDLHHKITELIQSIYMVKGVASLDNNVQLKNIVQFVATLFVLSKSRNYESTKEKIKLYYPSAVQNEEVEDIIDSVIDCIEKNVINDNFGDIVDQCLENQEIFAAINKDLNNSFILSYPVEETEAEEYSKACLEPKTDSISSLSQNSLKRPAVQSDNGAKKPRTALSNRTNTCRQGVKTETEDLKSETKTSLSDITNCQQGVKTEAQRKLEQSQRNLREKMKNEACNDPFAFAGWLYLSETVNQGFFQSKDYSDEEMSKPYYTCLPGFAKLQQAAIESLRKTDKNHPL